MTKIFIIVGIIILIIVIFAVYRYLKVLKQNRQLNQKRFDRIKLLYEKFENNQTVSKEDILPYAQNLLTRETTYQLLRRYDKVDLFPEKFYNFIKGAESNLANWLEFPTELDACPDEIEHLKRVTFDFDNQNNLVHYEVFQYRVNEPHWAAKEGWCLGIVGPFFEDSKPYDFAHATFSRIGSTVDKVTPEDEAKWVHENISMRK